MAKTTHRMSRWFCVMACLASVGALPSMAVQEQGGLGKAKLAEQPISVLGGRLWVRVPQGAEARARPHEIMSAPESEERETRVVFDAGPERLVLMVHETFAFAGGDLEKDVREWTAKWRGHYRIGTRLNDAFAAGSTFSPGEGVPSALTEPRTFAVASGKILASFGSTCFA